MEMNQLITGAFRAAETIEYASASIVSRQLLQNKSGNITLFAFDKGQLLSEHTAPFHAVCQICDGEAEIRIGYETHRLACGQMIIMPAHVPHSVSAPVPF